MSRRLYRAQILLEPKQRKTLAQIARQEGRSVSDLVRELIRLGLNAREQDPAARWRRRARVLEMAARQRAAMHQRRGGRPLLADVAALIQDMRGERDASLVGGVSSHRN